jgi:pyruvate kinase
VTIAAGDFLGDASRLSTSYDALAEDVRPGHRLLIDDGLIGLRVESIEAGTSSARSWRAAPSPRTRG